ncbi:MAG: hypothetical protein IKR39_08120 [Lachnospiraceae bacterium]|nr:hypothetical protein [Lachnospiraceae bacterium]
MKNVFCMVMVTAVMLGSVYTNASHDLSCKAEITCPYINIPLNDHDKTQNG